MAIFCGPASAFCSPLHPALLPSEFALPLMSCSLLTLSMQHQHAPPPPLEERLGAEMSTKYLQKCTVDCRLAVLACLDVARRAGKSLLIVLPLLSTCGITLGLHAQTLQKTGQLQLLLLQTPCPECLEYLSPQLPPRVIPGVPVPLHGGGGGFAARSLSVMGTVPRAQQLAPLMHAAAQRGTVWKRRRACQSRSPHPSAPRVTLDAPAHLVYSSALLQPSTPPPGAARVDR